jgi:hypothetical protein
VTYPPPPSRPLPGSEASQAAVSKRKAEMSKKQAAKKAKAGPRKTLLPRSATSRTKSGPATNVAKMAWPMSNPGM